MFTKLILSNGDVVEMQALKGHHYLEASYMANGNTGNSVVMGFCTICVISKVNGKKMEMEYLKQLGNTDVTTLLEAFNSQSINVKDM